MVCCVWNMQMSQQVATLKCEAVSALPTLNSLVKASFLNVFDEPSPSY